MSAAAVQTPALDDPKVITRTTHALSAGWTVHWLGLFDTTHLPLKLFLKNHFHLDAAQVAPLAFFRGVPV